MWYYWSPNPTGFVELLILLAICYGLYRLDKSGGCLKLFLMVLLVLFFLSICKSYDEYDKWDRERTEKLDNMARERKQKMEENSKKYGSPKMTPPSELPN